MIKKISTTLDLHQLSIQVHDNRISVELEQSSFGEPLLIEDKELGAWIDLTKQNNPSVSKKLVDCA